MTTTLTDFLDRILRIGSRAADTEENRIRKRYLLMLAFFILPAGFLWGAIYWFSGEPYAAMVPWGYSLLSALSIVIFALTANYSFFRLSEMGLILVAPFILGLLLGGFVNSSAVVLWSL